MTFKTLLRRLTAQRSSVDLSYIALRRIIGVLGIMLPYVCMIGGCAAAHIGVQESISDYYYTNMRDFFVGLMFLVGLFLLTYKGYDLLDSITTSVTGVFGLGIALFPCRSAAAPAQVGILQLEPHLSGILHLACAGTFFTLLGLTSIFLFTKTGGTKPSPRKLTRNRIYIVCGIVIIASVAGIIASDRLLSDEVLLTYKPILGCEAVALSAFGISWLIKGKTLFSDVKKSKRK